MNAVARRIYILRTLKENKSVDITELSKEFKVSAMTIRRDLSLLADQGVITLTHGGAIMNTGMAIEESYAIKQGQMAEEKKKIGIAAANMVNEGEVIFIDCGTTPKEVAAGLVGRKNITVITNSILAANLLLTQSPNSKLIMAPGTFRQKSMGFIGTMTIEFISRIRVDSVFLGVEGINAALGATTPDIDDAVTKRALVEAANKVIAVADHTKIGRQTLASVASLKQINTIITGKDVPDEEIDAMKKSGVNLLLV